MDSGRLRLVIGAGCRVDGSTPELHPRRPERHHANHSSRFWCSCAPAQRAGNARANPAVLGAYDPRAGILAGISTALDLLRGFSAEGCSESVCRRHRPFPHIVPMMAALAMQPHVEQDDRTTRLGSLDFALLLIWWLYLYLFAVTPWQYASINETLFEHNLNILYLTEKMVFLAGLVLLWSRSRGAWKTVYAHWFWASLTYALSSYV